MPACCGVLLDHRVKSNAPAAAAELWLAVAFHVESGIRGRGNKRASSSAVHGAVRPAVSLRTRATSPSVTTDAEFPKLLRTKLETSAIQPSLLAPIGAMTSAYLRPSRGPVKPWSSVRIT